MELTYEIYENGYTIFNNGRPWIVQYDEYSKPMDYNKSIEENCLLHIAELEEAHNRPKERGEING